MCKNSRHKGQYTNVKGIFKDLQYVAGGLKAVGGGRTNIEDLSKITII